MIDWVNGKQRSPPVSKSHLRRRRKGSACSRLSYCSPCLSMRHTLTSMLAACAPEAASEAPSADRQAHSSGRGGAASGNRLVTSPAHIRQQGREQG